MSWEAVAAIAAVITVSLVVAGIVFSGGRMVQILGQVRGEIKQLREEFTGLRNDLHEQARLSTSLQLAISSMEGRIGHLELADAKAHEASAAKSGTARRKAKAKRPSRRGGR